MSEAKIAVSFVASSADSEVPGKPKRRVFRAEEKKQILEETDLALANSGGVGAILRRQGIKLRRHNQRLQEDLEKAHIIIDVQKKWPSC